MELKKEEVHFSSPHLLMNMLCNSPPSPVMAVAILEGLPSPADVLAVTKQLYCVNQVRLKLNDTLSVSAFTTERMVGVF